MQDERARPAEPSVCVDSQHCYFSTFGVGAMMGIDLCPFRGGQVGAAGNRQRKRDQITPSSGPVCCAEHDGSLAIRPRWFDSSPRPTSYL